MRILTIPSDTVSLIIIIAKFLRRTKRHTGRRRRTKLCRPSFLSYFSVRRYICLFLSIITSDLRFLFYELFDSHLLSGIYLGIISIFFSLLCWQNIPYSHNLRASNKLRFEERNHFTWPSHKIDVDRILCVCPLSNIMKQTSSTAF